MGDPEPPITGKNIVNMRDYLDDLTVDRSANIMFGCDLHIGADSFPMHLASALEHPSACYL